MHAPRAWAARSSRRSGELTMSRIGRQPISVPGGVTVAIEPGSVRVNGPKGELATRIPRDIEVAQDGDTLVVSRPTDRGEHRALHGLTRSLVANMIEGVTAGYEKRLEIQGVGYRAQLKGANLELAVGYSHPVPISAPQGIDDSAGRTLAAVNWFEPELRSLPKPERTRRAGQALAERAKAAGVSEAVFDRGGYRYHGHVRAFAEAVREAGVAV